MNYVYKRPEGKLHKISVRKWNKVFGSRGLWPFVLTKVYLKEDVAVVQHGISKIGLLMVISTLPLWYLYGLFLQGFIDTHTDMMDVIFQKRRGNFSQDIVYKLRNNEEAPDWEKLMELLGK